ncbi:MAG: metal ABC transporter solute-binding protein, Zn/Mn family [Dehalococcoidales bacterium]
MVKYLVAVLMSLVLIATTACLSKNSSSTASSGVVQVVAAENFWGSIAAQVGGSHVKVVSIITDPNADPHSYEPTSQDARTVADAQYVIYNGVGYDAWMDKLLAANPSSSRQELNIGDYFGKVDGDNPHMWYNPAYVETIVNKIRDDLIAIDPADTAAFDQSAQAFLTTGLSQYNALIADINAKYSGTPVGATESIFAYMSPALGLDLITPPSYMSAVSEGTDISAADEATFEQQIAQKQIKVLVYNSQNTPPNVQTLLDQAKAQGIPIASVTETLVPATANFQDWQCAELQGIENALQQATGK